MNEQTNQPTNKHSQSQYLLAEVFTLQSKCLALISISAVTDYYIKSTMTHNDCQKNYNEMTD